MAKQKWFVSHPSKSQQHTPTFFFAIDQFRRNQSKIDLVLPHEKDQNPHLTRQEIEQADIVIAEVSIASTGSGIELGWASASQKRIIAFQQAGTQASPAIGFVTDEIHLYVSEEDIIKVLSTLI